MSACILYQCARAIREFNVAFQHQQFCHFSHPCSSSSTAKTQCEGIPACLSVSLSPQIAPSRMKVTVRATRTKENTSLEEDKD